jgi:hypothetical protein
MPTSRSATATGGLRARLQTGTPIGKPEAAKLQKLLKLGHMLAACFRPASGIAEQCRVDVNLLPDKGKHRFRQQFRRIENAARMTERAKLDSEAQAVGRSPLRSDQGEVFGAEDEVAGHFRNIGRDGKQPGALLGRQQGMTWHDDLDLMARDRS